MSQFKCGAYGRKKVVLIHCSLKDNLSFKTGLGIVTLELEMAREMAQLLRPLADLVEDPSSVPRIYMPSSVFHGYQACMWCTGI